MAPFLTWIPSAAALSPLELTYNVTVIRKRLLQTMVTTVAVFSPRESPTIIIQAPQNHTPCTGE